VQRKKRYSRQPAISQDSASIVRHDLPSLVTKWIMRDTIAAGYAICSPGDEASSCISGFIASVCLAFNFIVGTSTLPVTPPRLCPSHYWRMVYDKHEKTGKSPFKGIVNVPHAMTTYPPKHGVRYIRRRDIPPTSVLSFQCLHHVPPRRAADSPSAVDSVSEKIWIVNWCLIMRMFMKTYGTEESSLWKLLKVTPRPVSETTSQKKHHRTTFSLME